MVDDFQEMCDRLREMPRERVEEMVAKSGEARSQREFWRMMSGMESGLPFDREEALITAAKAMLADPGVFEHVARLKRRIEHLESEVEYLNSQYIYAAEHS